MKQRNATIDFMKGIAMVCVILCHAIQRAGCREQYILLWDMIYAWHMPLFFLISGYCTNTDKSAGMFLKEKTLRLLYPWFIWRFIEWLFRPFPFSGVMGFDKNIPYEFKDFLLSYITNPFRPMWFLIDLFLFRLIIYLLARIKVWITFKIQIFGF